MVACQAVSRSVRLQASVALSLLQCSVAILKSNTQPKPVKPRACSLIRRTVTFEGLDERLNSRSFKRAFRISKEGFGLLHSIVEPALQKNVEMGERSGRPAISSRMRLATTLRMLAGSSYLDIMIGFQIGASTTYAIFHETCEVLSNKLKLSGIPKTVGELQELALGFKHSRKSMSPFYGCIGAIDGIAIQIQKPRCRYAAAYYCRKGYYSLPVQALVDSSYRFIDVSIRCVGSTHDSLAHAVSKLGRLLEDHGLPLEFWIVGDEAYVCTEHLITPIPMSQVTSSAQDGFNYFLSSLRVHVEQAFGMLMARWRILNYLQYSVPVSSRIIGVCMKLHNFCVDINEGGEKSISNDEISQRNEDVKAWYECCKEQQWIEDLSDLSTSDNSISLKRESLVDIIREKGLRRPRVLGAPTQSFE